MNIEAILLKANQWILGPSHQDVLFSPQGCSKNCAVGSTARSPEQQNSCGGD